MQKRLGPRNAVELQYTLRYWANQQGWEGIASLIDLKHCFPKTKRRGVQCILQEMGFPDYWVNYVGNNYNDSVHNHKQGPRIYFLLGGAIYYVGRMKGGLEQGCRLSIYNLPLTLETLIQEFFFRVQRAQLVCYLWAFADDF